MKVFSLLYASLLLLFALTFETLSQSPYGRVLVLNDNGTQEWIDIMTVLTQYYNHHPTTPPSVWLTNGNNASSGDLLGTTNNQPLKFIVNNSQVFGLNTNGSIQR
ncbi:MAG: hypothetical protein ACUVQ1_05770, partial [Candidatus Kapaibacteriales bacterium]